MLTGFACYLACVVVFRVFFAAIYLCKWQFRYSCDKKYHIPQVNLEAVFKKYKKAANDLKMVRDLDNQNKQAQVALQRVLKYIKQDEGIDYIPQIDDAPLPELKKPARVVPMPTP